MKGVPLEAEQRQEVLQAFQQGLSRKEIVELTELPYTTVCRIINAKHGNWCNRAPNPPRKRSKKQTSRAEDAWPAIENAVFNKSPEPDFTGTPKLIGSKKRRALRDELRGKLEDVFWEYRKNFDSLDIMIEAEDASGHVILSLSTKKS